jgi:hypothetical protein
MAMALEQDLKLEMRLAAIEFLVNDLWVKYYLLIRAPYDRIMFAHDNAIEQLKRQTFPGLDPASSDLAASELEHAVRTLLSGQKEMLEEVKDLLGRL